MPLPNPTTQARLIHAVEKWADSHPSPDLPAIRILGKGALSPKQIVAALQERTPTGTLLLEVLENAVQQSSLEEVIEGFDKSLAQSRAVGHGD